MEMRQLWAVPSALALLVLVAAACAGGGEGSRERTDPDRLTREEIVSAGVTNLYDVVQRLRPRWLEVRAPRTIIGMDTGVVVVVDRTWVGDQEELKRMGVEVAASMQYMAGSRAIAEFSLPRNRHIEGVIIVRTVDHTP
jgi:hypothetical protein